VDFDFFTSDNPQLPNPDGLLKIRLDLKTLSEILELEAIKNDAPG